MNLAKWCERKSVSIRKAKKWVENGWIPGACKSVSGEYEVPEHARIPFTAARAKNNPSVLLSICTACNSYLGVSPSLYRMSEEEFLMIIQELIQNELINAIELDGITYYNPTVNTIDYIIKCNRNADRELLQRARDAAEVAGAFCGAAGQTFIP